MRVVFVPEVEDYFIELTSLLYDKEYFGFKESAVKYIKNLVKEIETTLVYRPSKMAPKHFRRYGKGMRYAIFPTNKHTQWYVFYNVYESAGELIFFSSLR